MIYPKNFETKIGFDEIRTLLKGHCLSTLGKDGTGERIPPIAAGNGFVSPELFL